MMRNLSVAGWALVMAMAWPAAAWSAGPGECDGVANRSPARDDSDRPRNSVNLSPEQRNRDCGQDDQRRTENDDERTRSRSVDDTGPASGPLIGPGAPADSRVRTRRPDRDSERDRGRMVDPSADNRHRSRPGDDNRDRNRRRDVGQPAGQVTAPAGGQSATGTLPLFPQPARPTKPAGSGG